MVVHLVDLSVAMMVAYWAAMKVASMVDLMAALMVDY